MSEHGENLLISGAWLLGLGTITAAIDQTQQLITKTDQGKGLVIKGNAIEAVGNSLQAIGRRKDPHQGYETSTWFYTIGCPCRKYKIRGILYTSCEKMNRSFGGIRYETIHRK